MAGSGKRIKDPSLGEQISFEADYLVLVDKLDSGSDDWLQARNMRLSVLGNTYFQGSSNGVNWHDRIEPPHSYLRLSTMGGGTAWIDLDTDRITEATNLYFTEGRVLDTPGVQDAVDNEHEHSNKTLLDNLIDNGPGSNILTDDGTYKSADLLEITLQDAYDQSTSPEILTDATREALTIQRGSTADTDLLLELKNGAGSTIGSIDAIGVASLTGTQYGTSFTPSAEPEGLVWWNNAEKTLNVSTGMGPVLQVGHEIHIWVYNDTVGTIPNGAAVYPTGEFGGVPTIGLAQTNTHETVGIDYGMTTVAIDPDSYGQVVYFGKARNLNTLAFDVLDIIWISADNPGELTNVRPSFPDYAIQLGIVFTKHETEGEIFVTSRTSISDTFNNYWNGVFRESFDFTITSVDSVVTGSLEPSNGHPDMTMIFSDGFDILDTDPAKTIVLTAGTDINPQSNYIYIPQATKVLTLSTSGFPPTEHIKVASVVLQSATTTEGDGALRNQNWNDHIHSPTLQGHMAHIGDRIRQINAEWDNGTAGSSTVVTNSEVYVANTSGEVYQMHKQTFPAMDTQVADTVHVVNDSIAAYDVVSDLAGKTLDADGDSLNNKSFSFVMWGVGNKSGEASHLMLNLPTGGYSKNSPENAVSDALNYSVYTIPALFKGVGFLIARFTYVLNSGSWSLYDTEDLRGKQPNNTAGGGAGGTGVTTYLGLTDTPSTYTALAFQKANAGATALENVLASTIDVGDFNDDGTYQTILTNPVTGTGTNNTLTKFTGTSTVGDSGITENGTTVDFSALILTTTGTVTHAAPILSTQSALLSDVNTVDDKFGTLSSGFLTNWDGTSLVNSPLSTNGTDVYLSTNPTTPKKFGININSPLTDIEIIGENGGFGAVTIGNFNNITALGQVFGAIYFRTADGSIATTNLLTGKIISLDEAGNGAKSGLSFHTATGGVLSEGMRLTNLKNLEVVGTVISTGYQLNDANTNITEVSSEMTFEDVVAGTTTLLELQTINLFTDVITSTYSTTATDVVLGVSYTSTGTCVITLDTDEVISGRKIIIKDTGGNAGSNNITINTENSETIDGSASFTISTNYDKVTLISDSTNWFIL